MTVAADILACERRRWALPGSRWDRRVRLLKAALPVAAGAVALLSMVWPLTAQQEFSFVLSRESVEMAGERLRIERPMYRGKDSKGRDFSILAEQAVQRTSNTPVVELTGIEARLDMAEGIATVTAPMGRYDLEAERLRVAGPVVFERPDGFAMRTADVAVDLATRRVRSLGAVSGRVPLGSFRAARLDADIEAGVVSLSGGVSMRITQR
jgi:lipopolysaccharide export system protein LptC